MLSSTRRHREELSEPRIGSRSLWRPRPHNPYDHSRIRSTFSFLSWLCSVWCRCLDPFAPCGDLYVAHSEQTLIHSGGDLSLSVVFADLPLARVFRVWEETFSITRKRTWMVALLGWSLCWLGPVSESPLMTTTTAYPEILQPLQLPLFPSLASFILFNKCTK